MNDAVLEAQKVSVKIPVARGQDVPFEAFVPVFHGWIQGQSVAGHLLVDVASYGHVTNGPGIVLIAHEANIGIDEQGGERGLLYMRKTPHEGPFEQRLARVVADAWSLARKLEEEPALGGKVGFAADRLLIRIHDRLRAPNTQEIFDAVGPTLERVLREVMGGEVGLTRITDSAELFAVSVRRRG